MAMKYTDTATTSQYPQPRQTYKIVTSDNNMTPLQRAGLYFVFGMVILSIVGFVAVALDRILTGE